MASSVVPTKTELIDLSFRSLWTFIVGFIGAFPSMEILQATFGNDVVINLSGMQKIIAAAILGGIPAVGTVVKAYASNKLGTGTATTQEKPVVGIAPQVTLQALESK